MRKKLMVTSALIVTALVGNAHAATDWFPGQTGQYHLIPDGQDVQDLTLVGVPDPVCQAGVALFSVDELGKQDTVPFAVPSRTVFVLTDALFVGYANAAWPDGMPVLSISQSTLNTRDRASFLATKPLAGFVNERFVGSGSLQSGAVFATGEKLCAHLSFGPDYYNGVDFNLELLNLQIHGKVIDDSRTTTWPYFSW